MVNAFFELSSNRRDIWQAGQDMQGDGRTRALWNVSLLRDVISPSYVRLLLRLREPLGFSEKYQYLWPSATLPAPWNNVYEATLARCRNERLIKRAVEEEQESCDEDTVSTTSGSEDTDIKKKPKQKSMFGFGKASVKADKGDRTVSVSNKNDSKMDLWIECHEAVLLPDSSTSLLEPSDWPVLTAVLLSCEQPLVVCSPSLWTTLTTSRVCETIALPPFVRNTIRWQNWQGGGGRGKGPRQYTPPQEYCRFLLSYCLSDNSMKSPRPTLELDSLPLLPLANEAVGLLKIMSEKEQQAVGELTSMGFSMTQAKFALSRVDNDVLRACEFLTTCDASDNMGGQDTAASSSIYIVCEQAEMTVFQMAAEILLDMSRINSKEVEFLTHTNMQKASNIRPFSANLVPDLLRRILPSDCFSGQPVKISALLGHEEVISFLKAFWEFMKLHPEVLVAAVEGAAIVSCRDGLLLPLSRMSHCIVQQRAESKIPDGILTILEVLGGHTVDETVLLNLSSSMPHRFWDYVHPPVRQGVLALLDLLQRANRQAEKNSTSDQTGQPGPPHVDVFESLSVDQRDQLLSYIAESEQISTLSGEGVHETSLFTFCFNSRTKQLLNSSIFIFILLCN